MPTEEILNEIERFCDDHNEAGCRYCPLELCYETCHGEFENDERAMNATDVHSTVSKPFEELLADFNKTKITKQSGKLHKQT